MSALLPPFPEPPKQAGICGNITVLVEASDVYRASMVGFIVATVVINLGGVLLFLKMKQGYLRLQERSIYMIIIFSLGNFMFLINSAGREVIGRCWYPCLALTWIDMLVFGFCAGPVVANVFVYVFKLRKERYFVMKATAFWMREEHSSSPRYGHEKRSLIAEKISFMARVKEFFLVWRSNEIHDLKNKSQVLAQNQPLVSGGGGASILDAGGGSSVAGAGEDMKKSKQSSSSPSLADWATRTFGPRFFSDCILPTILCFFVGAPFALMGLIRTLTNPFDLNRCLGCDREGADYLFMFGGIWALLIFTGAAIRGVWYEADPMGVKMEAVCCIIFAAPTVLLAWPLTYADPGGLEERGVVTWDFVASVALTFGGVIITYLQVAIAVYQRHLISGAGHYAIDINAVLEDEQTRNSLLKHCANELSSENVLFLIEVRRWKRDWEEDNAVHLVDRAKSIYETYISDISDMAINISHLSRSGISNEMLKMKNDEKPDQNLFTVAVSECEKIVLYDTMPRFQKTKIFKFEIIQTGLIDKIVKKTSGNDLESGSSLELPGSTTAKARRIEPDAKS